MKKYQTLFFDLDDTLLDFRAAELTGLQLLFKEQNISFTSDMEAAYKKINHSLWKRFEEGEISRDEVIHTRFSLFFKELGQEVDGTLFDQKYRRYLEEGHQMVEGAYELLVSLEQEYDIYVVTNGVSRTQDKRLRGSGLHPIFKGVFVSEDTGYQKPMKEFFDYVFAGIPEFSVEKALIIGDSLTADIKGGQMAGLDTCWFNPEKLDNPTDIVPTFEIHHLEELCQVLK